MPVDVTAGCIDALRFSVSPGVYVQQVQLHRLWLEVPLVLSVARWPAPLSPLRVFCISHYLPHLYMCDLDIVQYVVGTELIKDDFDEKLNCRVAGLKEVRCACAVAFHL